MTITAFPRLHITLIAMNNSGYRINGGIGFAIKDPKITANIVASTDFFIEDHRESKIEEVQISRIRAIITGTKEEFKFDKNISVSIGGKAHTHAGFGTGTIIRLICLEALFVVNRHPYDEDLLIKLSGRGGTSGIGIRTYFNGGFICDLGHKNQGRELLPSSLVDDKRGKSLLLFSSKMPDWEIGLCIPKKVNTLTHAQEKLFFEKNNSVTPNNVNETLYQSIFGVSAAIQEEDKKTFEKAIASLQKCEWKSAERAVYNESITKYEGFLYQAGATTVGMSSLGPSLFFLSDDLERTIAKTKENISDDECEFIQTMPSNNGRVIQAW